jgi:hypothetical protein
MQGPETYIKESRLHELFDFLGRYIRKAHTDDIILRGMKASPGISYLDMIMPGDIAYVIALMKNARELWDQDLHLRQLQRRWNAMSLRRSQSLLGGKD